MAAYDALTSLSETTKLLLHKIIIRKTTCGDGVDRRSSGDLLLQQLGSEIESLSENTDFLRSSLERSPAHPLEAQMKDAAEQAQVIMERFVLDRLPPCLTVDDDDVIFESLSQQLQRIHEDLISPAVEKIDNASDETDEESVGIFDSSSSRKILLESETEIFGVNDTIERLNHIVFDESSTELRVVSIVGMGGIGKTTLAECFHYGPIASEEFGVKGWVTVSRDFSARDILVSLADSIRPYIRRPKQRNESIENYVHSNLKGRRFLIVLDDMWSPEALRLLMRAFPDDGNGSAILITTTQEEVTTVTKHIIMMGLLDEDDSYELLVHKVFHNEGCPPELTDLSLSLTRICGGLPLAIVLVAGILRASNNSLHEWSYVFQKLSGIGDNYGQEMVDTILSLSYTHLPHRLRSCLLYMGAFPEDHPIKVGRLTKRLSAQGFMRKSTSQEVEQCVHYLVTRNLLTVLMCKFDYRIDSICLHDMVREFCLKKAEEEKFLRCVTDEDSDRDLTTGSKIKVSFNSDNLKRICNSDGADYDNTHTIMCFGRNRTRNRTLISIGRFKLLKSLDLANVEIESFPNEVLNLFFLRLLALGHVPELPPSISNLQYLETLIINDAIDHSLSSIITLPRILCVPSEIWSMSRLRDIVSFCCGALPSPNKENSPLQNLETLSLVMNLDCSKDLIEMIPNVTKLGIVYFGVEPATHSSENIKGLSRLEKLTLWVVKPFSAPQNVNLDFPTTLTKLSLYGICLSHRDMLIIGQLPRLKILKLMRNDFEGNEWRVTTVHGFQMLEYLLLKESGLRHWLRDSGDNIVFPMLKRLRIRYCNKLDEFEEVVENIPSLMEIILERCSKSLVDYVRHIKQSNENIHVLISK